MANMCLSVETRRIAGACVVGGVVVGSWNRVCLCLALVTLLEALTSQIDNLVLPLFAYMLLTTV